MLRNAVSAYGARLSLGAAAVAAPVAVAQCAKDDKKSVTSSFDPEALERGAKALREINSSAHAKRVRPGRRGIGRRRHRALDRRAFGDPWGNDVRSLNDIRDATPRHRARVVTVNDVNGVPHIGGFALTGQSGVFGYLQRLAVDPQLRRRGIARRLVADSMRWMQRRGATTAMVNTPLDNEAALALYANLGFRRRSEMLTILELTGDDLHRHGGAR